MPLGRQRRRQRPGALERPAQRRLGIAPGQGLHQGFQATRQVRIVVDQCRPASARASNATGRQRRFVELPQPFEDRDPRHPARATHQRHPAMPAVPGLGRGKQSARALVQMRPEERDPLRQRAVPRHTPSLRPIDAALAASLGDATQHTVDESRGIVGAEHGRRLYRLRDRYAVGHLVVEQTLPDADAHDRAVDSGHASDSPALRVRLDELVEFVAVLSDAGDALSGVAPRIGARLLRQERN